MNTPVLAAQPQNMAINLFDPAQFETMQKICKMYVNSDLVPESYRVTDKRSESKAVANCLIAVSMAQRMNADHMMVMQNLDIIQGRPSWSAKFLIATVNSCGRFSPLRYKFTNLGKIKNVTYTDYEWRNGRREAVTKTLNIETDNWECIAYSSEKGRDEILESTPITMEMAIKEGWYTKAGSKWQTMPRLMLQYRAASFWQRAYAPEISMGMITQEEARDIEDVDYIEINPEDKLKEELEKANKEEFKCQQEAKAASDPSPVMEDQPNPGNPEPPKAQLFNNASQGKPNWMRR